MSKYVQRANEYFCAMLIKEYGAIMHIYSLIAKQSQLQIK